MTGARPALGVSALIAALDAVGRAVVLRSATRTMSASEILERAGRAAKRLDEAGLVAGEVVAFRGLSAWDAVPALLAAWQRDIVVALLSHRDPVASLPRVVEQVHARVLVSEDDAAISLVGARRARRSSWLFGAVEPVVAVAPAVGRLDLPRGTATILFTSGSSGRQKMAVHTLTQHLFSAASASAELEFAAGDGWLLSLPLHHVGGLAIVLRALLAGATLLTPEASQSLGAALAELAPSHISLVATQLRRLLEHPADAENLARCRRVLTGGGPLPLALRQRALARRIGLTVSYGSTESTALIAASAEPEVVSRPNSAGRLLPGRELRVSGEGELRIAGSTLFLGYLEEGGLRDPRGPDGFFDSGDLGRIEADGTLYVEGRRDRMFITGGENVHPEEIEGLLQEFEGVDEVVVVPIEDEEFGQRPVAFVATSLATTSDDLKAYLRGELPGFKIPDAFYRLPVEERGDVKPRFETLASLLARPQDLQPL